MAQPRVAKEKKPEVRRVDPQYRVALPEPIRKALGVDVDDYVFFTVEDGRVVVRKVRLD